MVQSAAHKHDSTRRATYQDVLDAPADLVAEVIGGTLHTHPRPAPAHALATSALGADLGNPFQFARGGPSGGCMIDEPELHLLQIHAAFAERERNVIHREVHHIAKSVARWVWHRYSATIVSDYQARRGRKSGRRRRERQAYRDAAIVRAVAREHALHDNAIRHIILRDVPLLEAIQAGRKRVRNEPLR